MTQALNMKIERTGKDLTERGSVPPISAHTLIGENRLSKAECVVGTTSAERASNRDASGNSGAITMLPSAGLNDDLADAVLPHIFTTHQTQALESTPSE